MSERLVAAFGGEADCRRESGAVQWRIAGSERETGTPLEVLLSGAAQLQLPGRLRDAELHRDDDSVPPGWQLRGAGFALPLAVRAVQVHRHPQAQFRRALPPFAVPWELRAGWFLLLYLLRVPGMGRLLRRLRSRRHA
ncbi:MAG TPA: hypothetical protein VK505_02290 [Steroidobacteraceae bacterium]|nr:hypothetical protein [Steroidobacteraceae bacterium]